MIVTVVILGTAPDNKNKETDHLALFCFTYLTWLIL